jgi:hypothetical protein
MTKKNARIAGVVMTRDELSLPHLQWFKRHLACIIREGLSRSRCVVKTGL